MNELQKLELKILEDSYQELKKSTIDLINPVLLVQGLNFMNEVAISINEWNLNFNKYYYDKKVEIESTPISNVSINFDEVGIFPSNNKLLDESLKLSNKSEYKIAPYIDKPFTDEKINQVDFKRDLKSNIVLNKKVIRIPNGRPLKSEYYLDDELMAVIYFTFETNTSNLVTRRTETLKYIKSIKNETTDLFEDVEGNSIKIKEKIYDLSNISDASLAVKERINSRSYLVESIMIFINGVLQQYHPDKSQYEIITMITSYWDYSEKDRKDFVDLGLEYWEENLIAMSNPAPAEYSWLDYVIDGNGTTVKDYIISVISY